MRSQVAQTAGFVQQTPDDVTHGGEKVRGVESEWRRDEQEEAVDEAAAVEEVVEVGARIDRLLEDLELHLVGKCSTRLALKNRAKFKDGKVPRLVTTCLQ